MTREEFNNSLDVAVQKAYDELGDKLNALEGEPFEKLSKCMVAMYQDSIKQSAKIVLDTLEKSGVVNFD